MSEEQKAIVRTRMSVTFPLFASASASAAKSGKGSKKARTPPSNAPQPQGSEGGVADLLDFDLLAEYLLDDGSGASFDFSFDAPPASKPKHKQEVLPPNQAAFIDPLFETAAKAKNITDLPLKLSSGNHGGNFAQSQPATTPQSEATQQQVNSAAHTIVTPTPATGALAGAVRAPSPITPPAPPLSAPVVPVTAPVQLRPVAAPMPLVPVVAPAPSALAPAPSIGIGGVPKQPIIRAKFPDINGASNKRRRVDAGASAVAATTTAPVAPVMALSSQILPNSFSLRGGRQKSQAQIDRRRERNRILARRTRLRKKFFFESLQKDVTDLQRENSILKEIVRTRLSPDIAKPLLDECKASEELPGIVAEQCGVPSNRLDRQGFNLIQGIQKSQQCFVITDPSLQDNPIVYASDDFLHLTGYPRDEVLGKNCRFLQGTETSPFKVAQIRKAVAAGDDCTVTLINYTADGTAFWNNLFIAALRDTQDNIVNFIGVIVKVAGPDPSDPEAGKRLPGEVSPVDGLDDQLLNEDGDPSLESDSAAAAEVAEDTVKAIESVVSAAVAAAPAMTTSSTTTGVPTPTS